MNNVTIVKREDLGKTKWNEFVDNCQEAWFWHTWEFCKAISTWRYYTDISFAVTNEGKDKKVLAIFPLHMVIDHRIDSLGGLAIDTSLDDKDKERIYTSVIESLNKTGKKNYITEVNINPNNGHTLHGQKNIQAFKWVINLSHSEQELWDSMEKRARYTVRKTQNTDINIRIATEDDLEEYYQLHIETYNRTQAPPHPKEYFEHIFHILLPKNLCTIFLAVKENKIVAAGNFANYKDRSLYWTGASSSEGLKSGANSLIQWEAIKYFHNINYQYLETGEAFPSLTEGKSKQISDFKKSFGGELVSFFKGRIELPYEKSLLKRVLKYLKR